MATWTLACWSTPPTKGLSTIEDSTFQAKIRCLLEENGKSQAMLADYRKISPSHLSRVLKGVRPDELPLLEEVAG